MSPFSQPVLALDIGNSQTKFGLFINGKLEARESIETIQVGSSEFQNAICTFLKQINTADIAEIVASTVIPRLKPVIDALLEVLPGMDSGKRSVFWIDREILPELNTDGIDFKAYAQGELGSDRIANAIGGASAYTAHNVLVCDIGTTTTFDMVDSKRHYLGGAICPGPVKFQSLVSSDHAAQLFEVDVFTQPHQTPGLSTESSLQNGLYYGYKGLMLEILGNLLQQSGWPLSQVHIVFTGGYASGVREMLTLEIPVAHVDGGLTLCGLYRLALINKINPTRFRNLSLVPSENAESPES